MQGEMCILVNIAANSHLKGLFTIFVFSQPLLSQVISSRHGIKSKFTENKFLFLFYDLVIYILANVEEHGVLPLSISLQFVRYHFLIGSNIVHICILHTHSCIRFKSNQIKFFITSVRGGGSWTSGREGRTVKIHKHDIKLKYCLAQQTIHINNHYHF